MIREHAMSNGQAISEDSFTILFKVINRSDLKMTESLFILLKHTPKLDGNEIAT